MPLPPGTPDLDVLDLLVSVAETGSLGAAARRHGISQPAASMRMRALERRLRLVLLERGPTGSRLTDAGLAVVGRAAPVLAAAREFVAGVAALHSGHTPRLVVAASRTIADHRMPLWLTALRGRHADVPVSLEVGNTQQVCELVRAGSATLGFIEGPHAPAGLAGEVLGADELVIVVGQGHKWARRRKPVTLRELATTPLLMREPGSGTRDTVWEVLSQVCQPAAPAAELGSAAAIKAAAATGLAPAVISRLIAAPELSAGTLVEVTLADGTDFTRQFRAVWRPGAAPTGPARALVDLAASDA
ncbi:LysR family transcriptional regulator [Mycobacteroides chelonae]|uniref:LysR family transcriptional regulator n=1 Tax=Mycobacteroides chelonae TaxID=1774 RepID=UPI0008A88A59|nr:LysR family transcriptional regulator [Mycobacteroides chelonae]OHU61830.1 LysR family transcriptional regulator [Mycobacteroides chelonae]